jgi:uncharacterized protein
MTDISPAITASTSGTIITIEVTTGSNVDSFPAGYNTWRHTIGCHVAANPIGGKANMAIIGVIATFFGMSRNDVSIVSGMTSSRKKIKLTGLPPEKVIAFLEKVLPG